MQRCEIDSEILSSLPASALQNYKSQGMFCKARERDNFYVYKFRRINIRESINKCRNVENLSTRLI